MKNIIIIGSLVLLTIAGIFYANGSFDSKTCCKEDKSCASKKTSASVASECDGNCKAGEPCSCSGCSGECKEACEKAGTCVCGDQQKIASATVASKASVTCATDCDGTSACVCDDCSGECKTACEAKGACVCN